MVKHIFSLSFLWIFIVFLLLLNIDPYNSVRNGPHIDQNIIIPKLLVKIVSDLNVTGNLTKNFAIMSQVQEKNGLYSTACIQPVTTPCLCWLKTYRNVLLVRDVGFPVSRYLDTIVGLLDNGEDSDICLNYPSKPHVAA
ncbi:hypothetical protein PHYBLDRAFT_65153 [Phycomyces blakesleeanus NRRL 1555(-)]|uniref:Uncharacterized protein n=1 Tax=Phycomyces blakesleeanus (strain ATCC 8743b / DSM 1359 / FGSC 10004 / NBRC 33097 / NRRL 1555) TaxID=763407 RepID=A0A167MIB7_PHYB8|nr:hypothetical protein PHYBLDRAFT_65153 [Phycomyces blakesleeanus NRRL 1555(-)]OAD72919.1 hypothetical protein PHYBLDRAFT_65153 [Phycomyces blakesleeanus NRRL 1555(-)]|eukprot:XP_018290959.1 hypothetical protein PHYBLDRAFT_65153 [Phycomyces blakesleeanus NRRL 1555(-)]